MAASMARNERVVTRGFNRDLSAANLSRTVSLVSSDLAIFTFVLVFLFPRYASRELNGVLFQITLTTSLLGIFLVLISGISYFEAIAFSKTGVERKRALMRRGDSLFVVGLMISTAMPPLILFTLPGLCVVAIFATVLWILCAGFIVRQGQILLHHRTGPRPARAS